MLRYMYNETSALKYFKLKVCAHGFVPLALLGIDFCIQITVPAWFLNRH